MKYRKETRRQSILMLTLVILFAIGLAIAFISLPAPAEAAMPKNGIVYDENGYDFQIYRHGKMLTGWVKYKGKTYYLHKTSGERYKRGQATRNECRMKSGKYYYFGLDGSMATKSTSSRYSIFKIGKNHTVKMIYRKRGRIEERYNCKKGQYERKDDAGRWKKYEKIMWGGTDTQR